MLFGKTYEEKYKQKQEKLKKLKDMTWFAWYPVRENYGRIVWFQRVKVDYGIYKHHNGFFQSYKRPIYHII